MRIRVEHPNHPHQDNEQHEKYGDFLVIEQFLRIAKTALSADIAVWINVSEKIATDQGVIRSDPSADRTDEEGLNDERELILSVDEITFQQKRLLIPVHFEVGSKGAGLVFYRNSGSWTADDARLCEDVRSIATNILSCLSMQEDLRTHERALFKKSGLITLGQISAEIVHEINNPLATLHAGLTLLKIKAESTDLSQEYLKDILQKLLDTTDRINKIIYNIKKLSRKGENDPVEAFSIREMLDSSVFYCQQRLRALGIRFEGAIVPPHWISSCRMIQISQVLVNLMNNAMDAVAGTEKPWVRISVDQDADWIVIKVIDSGRGISEKLLKRLFEPFFTTKSESGGTGLGLSISRNLLEANGGMLEYAETDGHTTFLIKLPNSVQES
jgi:signal transduction histidine kinase